MAEQRGTSEASGKPEVSGFPLKPGSHSAFGSLPSQNLICEVIDSASRASSGPANSAQCSGATARHRITSPPTHRSRTVFASASSEPSEGSLLDPRLPVHRTRPSRRGVLDRPLKHMATSPIPQLPHTHPLPRKPMQTGSLKKFKGCPISRGTLHRFVKTREGRKTSNLDWVDHYVFS